MRLSNISHHRGGRLLLAGALVAGVGLVFAVALGNREAGGQPEPGLVALVPEGIFSDHWDRELNVQVVQTAEAARESVVRGAAWGIALDADRLNSIPRADLRTWARQGLVIVGINVPPDELIRILRDADALSDYEASIPEAGVSPFDVEGISEQSEPFFSYVVRSSSEVLEATGCGTSAGGWRRMSDILPIYVEGLQLTARSLVHADPGESSYPGARLACR